MCEHTLEELVERRTS